MATNRELQSNNARIGVDTYKIDPSETIQTSQIPDSLLQVFLGLQVDSPTHSWLFKADDDGNFNILSGGISGPAAFQIELGAKDSLAILKESDQLYVDGDLDITGAYYINGVNFFDTIKDIIKDIDWQDSVISATTDRTTAESGVSVGDRYIAPGDDSP